MLRAKSRKGRCTASRSNTGRPSSALPKSRARHYRLTLADALEAHELALQEGGRPGILNQGSIESAIARPYCGYYRSIQKKAAALVESAAGNHGFTDGNKRTCLLLLLLLLARSGYRLERDGSPQTQEAVEEMILSVARGEIGFAAIEQWMLKWVRRSH